MTTSREARSDLSFVIPNSTNHRLTRLVPQSNVLIQILTRERSQRAAKSTNSFCRRNGSQVLKSAQLCVMMRLAGDEGGSGAASATGGTHSIHSQV
uniref:Uncharacterized protein n=1 Tax=Ditylenchus dipsaci TaxID=166011 RepID=A0A915D0G3_9BILA